MFTVVDGVRDVGVRSPIDPVYTPIIAALIAVSTVFFLAIVGFLIHRRRTTNKQPPRFGGSIVGGGGGGSTTPASALLAGRACNGSGVTSSATGVPNADKRRGGETSSSNSPQHHLYSDMRDRPSIVAAVVPGQTPHHYIYNGQQPLPLQLQAQQSGTPSTSGTAASQPGTAASRDRIVRSVPDSSYSDYSSVSRTPGVASLGVVSPPPPHLYSAAVVAAHQQQQQFYQMQQQPQLRYYEGC